jgi:hypothetical protein
MKPYKVSYDCPECEASLEVKVFPYAPAKTSFSYEDNEPSDGGYCEPEECKCGCSIDYECVQEHE